MFRIDRIDLTMNSVSLSIYYLNRNIDSMCLENHNGSGVFIDCYFFLKVPVFELK